jgi:hypothetical protein
MNDKFRILMQSVDDDLLEEAMQPVSRKSILRWVIPVAACACLLLTLSLPMLRPAVPSVSLSELRSMGYGMTLPETVKIISYALITQNDRSGAEARFLVGDTEYVYREEKTVQPQTLSSSAAVELLSWNAESLDIQLCTATDSTSVSWYTGENQIQGYLTAQADSLTVLTTASQILRSTGLDVTVAPEEATDITYNAFLLDGLTVAETTFVLDGIRFSYRMAATAELLEAFKDISGIEGPFERISAGEVAWCRAKINYTEGEKGRIIWFDVVPGILYSMSMEQGASDETLLELANELFEPAQDTIG